MVDIIKFFVLVGLVGGLAVVLRPVYKAAVRVNSICAIMDSAGVDVKCLILVTEARKPSWDGKKPERIKK